MPQLVACRCGQSFQAEDFLINQTVPCPACGAPLAIASPYQQSPQLQPIAQLQPIPPQPRASGRTKPCPSCRQAMPVEAASCPHCWYMMDQGPRRMAVEEPAAKPARKQAAAEYDPKFVHTVVGVIAHVITLGLAAVCYQRVGNWVDAGYMATGPGWLAFLIGLATCGIAALQQQAPRPEMRERGKRTMFWGQVLVFWGFAMGALGALIANVLGGGMDKP